MSNVSIVEKIVKIRESFDFGVGTYPLTGPDNVKTDMYGVFRTDTWEAVADKSVKKGYTPHTSDDVCALVEAAQSVFEGDFDVQCHFNKGHYVSIAPTDAHWKKIINTNDDIRPRMLIDASYNGNAFRSLIGYYRHLCRNMSMMRTVSSTSVSIRHTSGLRAKMDELIDNYQSLQNGWEDLNAFINRMNTTETRVMDFMTHVFGARPDQAGRGQTIHDNRTAAIISRIFNERQKMGKALPQCSTEAEVFQAEVSVWEMFNGIQGFSQHDQSRKNSPNDFARMLLASSDTAVKKAEEYAAVLVA